jgi:RHS repeat-associated protein
MPTQTRKTILLATDRQNSVLNAVGETGIDAIPYSVYGHSPLDASQSRLRFIGEFQELRTGFYPLGNGYRMYSPVLMRFISPDSYLFSPFGVGWLNTYVYCEGDPINNFDLTGRFKLPVIFQRLRRFVQNTFNPASRSPNKATKSRPDNRRGSSDTHASVGSTSSEKSSSSGYEIIRSVAGDTPDPFSIGPSHSVRKPNPIFTEIQGVTVDRGFYPSRKLSIREWQAAQVNITDPQLDKFTQLPWAGSTVHSPERLDIRNLGIRRENRLLVTENVHRRPSNLPSWVKH